MKDVRFEMRASEDWLKMVDDWRRKQPSIPSRAEAIRQMAVIAAKQKKERANG